MFARSALVSIGLLCLAVTTPARAGFDWGGDCSTGSGEFEQYISYYATVTVGQIPAGKRNVRIDLVSDEDVDVQLYDQATGHAIIAWPYGDLSGATVAETSYDGVTYRYSGYNGVDGQLGHEFIEIIGDTNRPLVMKAFGYASGEALVTYSWEPVPTCHELGDGSFSQYVPYYDTVVVGDIPAGKTNVRVELKAAQGKDVDIQLIDASNGHAIVAWPNGDLNGSGYAETTYEGMVIGYSGYNGKNGNLGWEEITVTGKTSVTLTMRAFGYKSGTANVSYAWGLGVGEPCGGKTNPPLPACPDELVCKGELLSLDIPGQCHTDDWCLNPEMAPYNCANMPVGPIAGTWTCVDFQCKYLPNIPQPNTCEAAGGSCIHFLDTCGEGTFGAGPTDCPGGKSSNCCLPFGEDVTVTVDDDGVDVTLAPGDVLVMDLARGNLHPCYSAPWVEASLAYDGDLLSLLGHEVVANPDCPGIGCDHDMDRFRLVALPAQSPGETDVTLDQGPAPDWCDDAVIGEYGVHVTVE